MAGQQFEYAFDDIGNRVWTGAGGDEGGTGLRPASYSANLLNQYTSRDVPGAVHVLGIAFATNSVTVNGQSVYRKGEYFRKELSVDNSAAPVWTNITVAATGQASGPLRGPRSVGQTSGLPVGRASGPPGAASRGCRDWQVGDLPHAGGWAPRVGGHGRGANELRGATTPNPLLRWAEEGAWSFGGGVPGAAARGLAPGYYLEPVPGSEDRFWKGHTW